MSLTLGIPHLVITTYSKYYFIIPIRDKLYKEECKEVVVEKVVPASNSWLSFPTNPLIFSSNSE